MKYKTSMNKRVNFVLLISLLLVSVFVAGIVAGQDSYSDTMAKVDASELSAGTGATPSTPSATTQILTDMANKDPTGCGWLLPKSAPASPAVGEYFFYDRCVLWIGGAKLNELGEREVGVVGNFLKWFVLFLVIILIFSALNEVEFPSNSFLRILLSLVVGFLSTFFITTKELITALTGYTALGLTLVIFFPIAILAFFTIVIARKGKAFGLYAQKIMWMIYSIFLLIKAGILFVIMQDGWTVPIAAGKPLAGTETFWGIPLGVTKAMVSNYDATILFTLMVTAVAVFVIMGLGNKIIREWLAGEAAETAIEAQKELIKKSQGLRRAEADAVDKT